MFLRTTAEEQGKGRAGTEMLPGATGRKECQKGKTIREKDSEFLFKPHDCLILYLKSFFSGTFLRTEQYIISTKLLLKFYYSSSQLLLCMVISCTDILQGVACFVQMAEKQFLSHRAQE